MPDIIKVGDEVKINFGPWTGATGIVTQNYSSGYLAGLYEVRMNPAMSFPFTPESLRVIK